MALGSFLNASTGSVLETVAVLYTTPCNADPARVPLPRSPKAAMAAIDPLETLSNAIDGIESRYEVHGSFALDGLTLTCGDASVTLPQTRGAQDAALAPLLAAAEASPFGHGGETKLDDKVRVAPHHGRQAAGRRRPTV